MLNSKANINTESLYKLSLKQQKLSELKIWQQGIKYDDNDNPTKATYRVYNDKFLVTFNSKIQLNLILELLNEIKAIRINDTFYVPFTYPQKPQDQEELLLILQEYMKAKIVTELTISYDSTLSIATQSNPDKVERLWTQRFTTFYKKQNDMKRIQAVRYIPNSNKNTYFTIPKDRSLDTFISHHNTTPAEFIVFAILRHIAMQTGILSQPTEKEDSEFKDFPTVHSIYCLKSDIINLLPDSITLTKFLNIAKSSNKVDDCFAFKNKILIKYNLDNLFAWRLTKGKKQYIKFPVTYLKKLMSNSVVGNIKYILLILYPYRIRSHKITIKLSNLIELTKICTSKSYNKQLNSILNPLINLKKLKIIKSYTDILLADLKHNKDKIIHIEVNNIGDFKKV